VRFLQILPEFNFAISLFLNGKQLLQNISTNSFRFTLGNCKKRFLF